MGYRPQPAGFRDPVADSDDLARVLALPRRAVVDLGPGSARAAALVELMTARLRRPDRPPGAACGCVALGRRRCVDRLMPAQAWALYEAPLAGGLLAPIGVGSGKTLLDVLMPIAMRSKVAVVFVPPKLVEQLEHEYLAIREHFVVPSLVLPGGGGHYVAGAPVAHVVPYSRLCRPESTELLERLRPDLIVPDEVHRLKNPEAAQTSRFLRYFVAHPKTRLCGWSGTITARSIKDFAHLTALALGESSPLPIDGDQVDAWAAALDPSDWPAPSGALKKLVAPGETVLEAVGRRVRETRGVVSTGRTTSCGASVVLRERALSAPAEVEGLIREVRASWVRPDGEELLDAIRVDECATQLACGFYYRWRFPGQPDPTLVEEWFAARKAWGREMREQLRDRRPHLDSPKLLANAAARAWSAERYVGDLPTWRAESWPRWSAVKNSVKHVTEAVWVDEYLARDAAEWGRANLGIVWYGFRALGERVAEISGLPLVAGGPKADEQVRALRGDRSIVASMGSHGEGRDGLQYLFSQQLVIEVPSLGKDCEQLLGRLHRPGQLADEVVTHAYRHLAEFRDPLDKAVRDAKYVDGLLSSNQRLLAADVEWVNY